MKRNIVKMFLGVLFCCFCMSAKAQILVQTNPLDTNFSWYLGIKGGIPFGICTFSSFGENKTRAGYDMGVYGGYNINKIFSVEAFLMHGQIDMSFRGGDDYWLDYDGTFYYVPVYGMKGCLYSKLHSIVTMTRIGVQYNIDFMQFLSKRKNQLWKLYISPAISAVYTSGTVKIRECDEVIFKGSNNLHLGFGGDISPEYQLTYHLCAQIYSNIIWLTGEGIDAMPEHLYSSNCIVESGIKLVWTLGKKKKKPLVKSSPGIFIENSEVKNIEPDKNMQHAVKNPDYKRNNAEPKTTILDKETK